MASDFSLATLDSRRPWAKAFKILLKSFCSLKFYTQLNYPKNVTVDSLSILEL